MEKGRFTRPITKDGTITLTPALRAAHAQQCQHQDCEEARAKERLLSMLPFKKNRRAPRAPFGRKISKALLTHLTTWDLLRARSPAW